jgi:RNA polymerase sigma-70 factor, ECF subfamily
MSSALEERRARVGRAGAAAKSRIGDGKLLAKGLEVGMSDPFRDEVVALIPPLRGYAIALTRSSAEADDLVQDALVRAWQFRSGFKVGTNLKAWLYKILRNTFYTQWEKRRKTVQDVDGRLAAQLVSNPDQEWRLVYDELLVALGQLSQDTRDALLLVVAAGLTYEEAADVAGCAVGTMKSRVNRARERLAQLTDFDLAVVSRNEPKQAAPQALSRPAFV